MSAAIPAPPPQPAGNSSTGEQSYSSTEDEVCYPDEPQPEILETCEANDEVLMSSNEPSMCYPNSN